MQKASNSKDILMLLLYAKGATGLWGESIKGRIRLMKMVFLFNKEIRKYFNLGDNIPDAALPDFRPYDYGPFSDKVYQDLELLVDLGFVQVKKVDGNDEEESLESQYWQVTTDLPGDDEDSGMDEFLLTTMGKSFVKEELQWVRPEQWDGLNKFKNRCASITLNALLKYVYTKYPEMTTESKIRNKILK